MGNFWNVFGIIHGGAKCVRKITKVEDQVARNLYQRSELDWLVYNDPLGYVDLVFDGDLEEYLKTVTQYKPLD